MSICSIGFINLVTHQYLNSHVMENSMLIQKYCFLPPSLHFTQQFDSQASQAALLLSLPEPLYAALTQFTRAQKSLFLSQLFEIQHFVDLCKMLSLEILFQATRIHLHNIRRVFFFLSFVLQVYSYSPQCNYSWSRFLQRFVKGLFRTSLACYSKVILRNNY